MSAKKTSALLPGARRTPLTPAIDAVFGRDAPAWEPTPADLAEMRERRAVRVIADLRAALALAEAAPRVIDALADELAHYPKLRSRLRKSLPRGAKRGAQPSPLQRYRIICLMHDSNRQIFGKAKALDWTAVECGISAPRVAAIWTKYRHLIDPLSS